jgi:threonine aldolase
VSLPGEFASDNAAPVHPAVLREIEAANTGLAPAYGADPWTARALEWFQDAFGPHTEAFLVWNGTGANVVALQAMLHPWQAVICSSHAHINVDECGAPERFSGCKLVDIATPDGKLTPELIETALTGIGDQHRVQPRVISLTQSSEYGTVYDIDEIRAISRLAHARNMLVHVDGARIANAAAALGVTLRACTVDAGVDILSFGATKNGGMGAEAVVIFDRALAANLPYIRKQSAQLASKMRFLAAQFIALANGDLWLENARHANAMANRLAEAVRSIPGVTITQRVDANAIFALVPPKAVASLQERFHFYTWDERTGEVRWMTNWATASGDVDEFAEAIRLAVAAARGS